MRYISTILDVICYHDKTNVSSTSSQISISGQFIFDIARLKNDELIYKEENISDEARLSFDNNRSKLHCIANGVVQFYLPSGSCSGFYSSKNLIGTNKHNITQIELSSLFTDTNDIYASPSLLKQCTTVTNDDSDFAYERNKIMSLNIVETTLFDPNKYSNLRERHIEKDPILGITGDFDMIDFLVVKVLAVISYHRHRLNPRSLSPFSSPLVVIYLSIFSLFSSLCSPRYIYACVQTCEVGLFF